MKEKRYVTLGDYERRIIVLSLNRLRNRVIADGIDPIDVDRMLLKMARLQKQDLGGRENGEVHNRRPHRAEL